MGSRSRRPRRLGAADSLPASLAKGGARDGKDRESVRGLGLSVAGCRGFVIFNAAMS